MKNRATKPIGCGNIGYPLFIAFFYLSAGYAWFFFTDDIFHGFIRSYGEYRYFEVVKSVFFVVFGAVVIFVLITINNRKLKASLIKHTETEQDMLNFFDATLDKIAIIDKNGMVLGCNEAFLNSWPFSQSMIYETKFINFVFIDDRNSTEEEINKVFSGKRSVDFENRFYDKDGKYAWHSWRMVRAMDASKVYLVGRNISRQKENERHLENDKQNCLWILDNMPLPMWKNDITGKCEYINKAWYDFTGTTSETQLGEGWINTLHPDDAQACYASYMKAAEKRESWQMEYRLRHVDGSYHWVCDNGKPLYSMTGEYIGYVGAIYDIQARKETEEQLIKKDELLIIQSRFAAMGEMISMIAHQWRQPITAIGMSANNMSVDIELDNIDKVVFKKHLDSISEQVQYLSKTIDDFRNFFKPNKKKESVILSELVQKALQMISRSYENNGINLSFENNLGGVVVEVYSGELIQSFLSILNNAKDVLVERKVVEPSVSVRTGKSEDGYVFVEVEDNAGGIDPSIIDKIFNPYFTTKSEKSGTGLGLYMAKIIVEKHHGGKLVAKNGDSGALFSIKLPL